MDNMEYLSKQKHAYDFKIEKGEELADHLNQVRNVEYERKDGTYNVYFENLEDEKETEEVLASDEKLIEYYQEHDPKMLESYNSRWSINVVGKKKDKKALRKHHLKSRSLEGRKEKRIKEYREIRREDERKLRKKDSKEPFNVDKLTDEQVEKDIRDMDVADIASYYKTYREMDAEKLDELQLKAYKMAPERRHHFAELVKKAKEEEVKRRMSQPNFREYKFWVENFSGLSEEGKESAIRNYLFVLESSKLKDLRDKVFEESGIKKALDRDLTEEDSEEIRELQTKYAKVFDETYDYTTYRLLRMVEQHHETVKVPEEVKTEAKEKKGYDGGDINRTCSRFLKSVNYIEKDGKQVPATKEDEENAAFNQKWVESLLSDKEEDWNFRFEYMTNMIDETFDRHREEMEHFDPNTYDYNKVIQDYPYYARITGSFLCISGINTRSEENGLAHSKYFTNLPKERQEELEAKELSLNFFFNIILTAFAERGVDPDKMDFFDNGGEQKAVTAGQKTANVTRNNFSMALVGAFQDALQKEKLSKDAK